MLVVFRFRMALTAVRPKDPRITIWPARVPAGPNQYIEAEALNERPVSLRGEIVWTPRTGTVHRHKYVTQRWKRRGAEFFFEALNEAGHWHYFDKERRRFKPWLTWLVWLLILVIEMLLTFYLRFQCSCQGQRVRTGNGQA